MSKSSSNDSELVEYVELEGDGAVTVSPFFRRRRRSDTTSPSASMSSSQTTHTSPLYLGTFTRGFCESGKKWVSRAFGAVAKNEF